eukprot:136811_1
MTTSGYWDVEISTKKTHRNFNAFVFIISLALYSSLTIGVLFAFLIQIVLNLSSTPIILIFIIVIIVILIDIIIIFASMRKGKLNGNDWKWGDYTIALLAFIGLPFSMPIFIHTAMFEVIPGGYGVLIFAIELRKLFNFMLKQNNSSKYKLLLKYVLNYKLLQFYNMVRSTSHFDEIQTNFIKEWKELNNTTNVDHGFIRFHHHKIYFKYRFIDYLLGIIVSVCYILFILIVGTDAAQIVLVIVTLVLYISALYYSWKQFKLLYDNINIHILRNISNISTTISDEKGSNYLTLMMIKPHEWLKKVFYEKELMDVIQKYSSGNGNVSESELEELNRILMANEFHKRDIQIKIIRNEEV